MFIGTESYPLEHLNKENRRVKPADHLPWDDFETEYNKRLNNQAMGAGNKPGRMIISATIVKHVMGLSDEETIPAILENPYMRYWVGLKYFSEECVGKIFHCI